MPRVLVLTRQPTLAQALRRALDRRPYEIWRVGSVDRFHALLRDGLTSLIITDLEISNASSEDQCRRLREASDAAILVVTSRPREESCVSALRAGADDYVAHSVSAAELAARIEALLRRVKVAAQDMVEAGDLRINLHTREVGVAGRLVHLRPTEFDLLAHLVRYPSQVHTHAMLLTAIWGPALQRRPHYVRMCVAHLRRQIEPDASRPCYIVTERGIGYRLEPTGSRPSHRAEPRAS